MSVSLSSPAALTASVAALPSAERASRPTALLIDADVETRVTASNFRPVGHAESITTCGPLDGEVGRSSGDRGGATIEPRAPATPSGARGVEEGNGARDGMGAVTGRRVGLAGRTKRGGGINVRLQVDVNCL